VMSSRPHLIISLLTVAAVSGCGTFAPQGPLLPVQNPQFVPVNDREFLFNQVVDTVDDYFRIRREQRVRVADGVIVEGRIDTFPEIAGTALEPWKRDSTPGFERQQATLQTIRRTATVRVTPTQGGYLVSVVVTKELEDLSAPQNSNTAAAILTHGSSIEPEQLPTPGEPVTLGWIPVGRDQELETRILAEIRDRASDAGVPVRLPPVE